MDDFVVKGVCVVFYYYHLCPFSFHRMIGRGRLGIFQSVSWFFKLVDMSRSVISFWSFVLFYFVYDISLFFILFLFGERKMVWYFLKRKILLFVLSCQIVVFFWKCDVWMLIYRIWGLTFFFFVVWGFLVRVSNFDCCG